MAYNIRNLKNHNVIKGEYLFDSCIWIDRISGADLTTKGGFINYYPVFFQNIFNNPDASIVVPSLMISEILNAYLYKVGMANYAEANKLNCHTPNFFKEKYRPSSQFDKDLLFVLNEFQSYLYTKKVKIIDDKFNDVFYFEVQSDFLLYKIDFNDLFYYQLAKRNGYKIVTSDKDFFLPDVEIFTLSRPLIDRVNSKVVASHTNYNTQLY
jgi:hypothetical protein